MDPQFSSNMFNLVAINPAAAGRTDQMNAYGLWREQWVGFENNPSTFSGSYDANVNLFKLESGIGLSILNDNLGLFNNLSINFIYSYRKRIWNGALSVGFYAGFINLKQDGEADVHIPGSNGEGGSGLNSEYLSQLPTNFPTEFNDLKFDMGLGAFFDHDVFYAGLSVSRITKPELEISVSDGNGYYLFFNRVFYATAGFNYVLPNNPKYELKPSIFYKTDGVISQADFNCNVWYNKDYYGGLSYRIQEGFIILAGIKLQTGLNLGIAVDLTTSRMRYGTWGSYEIYAAYSFDIDMNKQKSKHKSVRFL